VVGGLISLLNFSIGLSFYAISPLLPLVIDDYSISRTSASLLVGLVIFVQAGLSIPCGIIAARLDKKLILGIGALLSSSLVLTFLAKGFGILLALRVVYGIGMALIWPVTGPLVMQWFSPRERPLWNSISMGATGAGMAVSMFVAAPLAGALGWRNALSLLSVTALVGTVVWFVFGRARGERRDVIRAISLREIRSTVFSRLTLLMSMVDSSCYALYAAVTSWLPTFYNEALGLSLTRVGFIAGLLPFAGLFGVLAGGALAVRFQRRKPLLIVPGVMLGLSALGSFLPSNVALIYPSVFMLGFMAWFWSPILFSIPMELPGATPEKVAMVWGTVGTFASVMGSISPLTVGAIRDTTGSYVPGFLVWSAFSILFLVAVLLLPETGRTSRRQTA
jgi:MFS family permease